MREWGRLRGLEDEGKEEIVGARRGRDKWQVQVRYMGGKWEEIWTLWRERGGAEGFAEHVGDGFNSVVWMRELARGEWEYG